MELARGFSNFLKAFPEALHFTSNDDCATKQLHVLLLAPGRCKTNAGYAQTATLTTINIHWV